MVEHLGTRTGVGIRWLPQLAIVRRLTGNSQAASAETIIDDSEALLRGIAEELLLGDELNVSPADRPSVVEEALKRQEAVWREVNVQRDNLSLALERLRMSRDYGPTATGLTVLAVTLAMLLAAS